MAGNVQGDDVLLEVLTGRKIASVQNDVITLDDGTTATLEGYGACCAWAQVEALLLHPNKIDHAITGVRYDDSDDRTEVWHFMADMADVLDVTIGYNEGTGYYSFGIDVQVSRAQS